ncbi:CHAT domain-containing protein [Larkinella terrae]|uniref:CHAT domain-containing protein n=1 Tax=Larkinella terrae TaxID=2025311 RepID=A0A7K0ELK2_9BACT|nr:CHAT domain-containing protein [Larkinella terrae]MRS62707.1 CHAT domain-containing protein [Larkinella terrae]
MTTKPIILVASANTSNLTDQGYLSELKDEIKSLNNLFDPLELKGDLIYRTPLEGADADDVFKAITDISENLTIFHYSGHASQTHFVLTDGNYNQNQLIKLLSGKKPKLIFLNGCSTYGYVEALLDNGVGAVIATSTAVPDGQASKFAKDFYYAFTKPLRTLEQAFDEAVSTLPKLAGHQSLYLRGSLSTESPETPCAWGLYYRNADILSWDLLNKRPKAPAKTTLIDLQKAYICGRDDYRTAFDSSFRLDVLNRTVQHYLMVGEDYQSPLGLARKLVYEKITNNTNTSYTYPFNPTENRTVELNGSYQESIKINFEVYKALKGQNKSDRYAYEDIISIPEVQHSQFTIVALQIKADDLKEKKVVDSIRQFMVDFRPPDDNGNPTKPPYLLFFWNIIYKPSESWFSSFIAGNPVKKILKPFREFGLFNPEDLEKSPLIILNENDEPLLVPDAEVDIQKWLKNNLTGFISLERMQSEVGNAKQRVCDTKGKKTDASKLEILFRDLIDEINTKSQPY